jgi:glycosyltransferase involved in cell wall biosynthesis
MLLTFGLLGPNKGIETVIQGAALPSSRPAPTSSTSSSARLTQAVIRHNGEAYRTTLEREAERLGVRDHVVFRDQYVTTDELCNYLQATDVFVSPYLNEAQVTSGALSYAMGAGAAVVSTPYWHAKELLADGRGRLVRSPTAPRSRPRSLRSSRHRPELARVRSVAYEYTRAFTWPRVGEQYLNFAAEAPASPRSRPADRRLPAPAVFPSCASTISSA